LANTIDVRKATKTVKEGVKNGLAIAGLRMLRDIVLEAPRPPLKTGFLRGSGSVFVEDKLTATSQTLGQQGGKPPTSNAQSKKETATVVLDTPYAARLDQRLEPEGSYKSHFTQDAQIGGGFMTKKIADPRRQKVYASLIANGIKKELDS
jgi:hypothetical protein